MTEGEDHGGSTAGYSAELYWTNLVAAKDRLIADQALRIVRLEGDVVALRSAMDDGCRELVAGREQAAPGGCCGVGEVDVLREEVKRLMEAKKVLSTRLALVSYQLQLSTMERNGLETGDAG